MAQGVLGRASKHRNWIIQLNHFDSPTLVTQLYSVHGGSFWGFPSQVLSVDAPSEWFSDSKSCSTSERLRRVRFQDEVLEPQLQNMGSVTREIGIMWVKQCHITTNCGMVSFIPPIKILIWEWFMTLFYPHEFVILSRKYRRKKCVYTYIYI